jgi:hypothetical protein
MAYGTINYVKNFINIIPIAVGAWVGTYGILKFERIRRNKRRREKQKNSDNIKNKNHEQ